MCVFVFEREREGRGKEQKEQKEKEGGKTIHTIGGRVRAPLLGCLSLCELCKEGCVCLCVAFKVESNLDLFSL